MRIGIDAAACTGHGRCYGLAPEIFDCDDQGHGVVLRRDVPLGLEPAAVLAADNCPERAVIIDGTDAASTGDRARASVFEGDDA